MKYFFEMSVCYNIEIYSTFQLNKLHSPTRIAVDNCLALVVRTVSF
jgi:hypothetical protein